MKKLFLVITVVYVLSFAGCEKSKTAEYSVHKLNDVVDFSSVHSMNDNGLIMGFVSDESGRKLTVYNSKGKKIHKQLSFERDIKHSCFINEENDVFGTVSLTPDTWTIFILRNNQNKIQIIELENGFNPVITDYNDEFIAGYYTGGDGKRKPLLLTYQGKQKHLNFNGKICSVNAEGDLSGTLYSGAEKELFFRTFEGELLPFP